MSINISKKLKYFDHVYHISKILALQFYEYFEYLQLYVFK